MAGLVVVRKPGERVTIGDTTLVARRMDGQIVLVLDVGVGDSVTVSSAKVTLKSSSRSRCEMRIEADKAVQIEWEQSPKPAMRKPLLPDRK